MKYHLTGTADFSRPQGASVPIAAVNFVLSKYPPVRGGPIYADIKLPDTLTFSALTKLNDKWDIVGDLAWTGWAKIPDLTFKYQDKNDIASTTTENWRNTWRVALGAIHRYNDTWTARAGIAYDQTPVGDDYRTVRLPDSNRTWISLGGQYRMNKDAAIDFGYSHLFIKDGSMNQINQPAAAKAAYGALLGTYNNAVDILSVQYSLAF
jgi:long-chain fatty acid transport protein